MQQIMYSFVGEKAPAEVLAGVKQGEIGAFCLFAYSNISTPAQLRELTDSLRRAAQAGGHLPPLLGVDQEGGQLQAITSGTTELPGNMALGATRSPELARAAGRVLGRELLAMGINMNFAPVLDVNINPENPVVGIRSFGDDPLLVGELGTALIEGMQAEGVLGTPKHFPGHGDTSGDSHHITPHVRHPLDRLQIVELKPFLTALKTGQVAGIITAHVIFDSLDPEWPATVSRRILYDFLRQEWGYTGLILTDAMDMDGIARYGHVESVRMALQAGVDLAMLGHIPDQLKLAEQVKDLIRPEAIARIQRAKEAASRLPLDFSIVGSAEHQQVAQQIAEKSITLVKNVGQLPLRLNSDQKIAVITPQPVNLTPADTSAAVKIKLAEAVQRRHARTHAYELPHQASDAQLRDLLTAIADTDTVIVGTIGADQQPAQAELVRALQARGQQPIVIALRTPYDLIAFPAVENYLCTYSIRPVSMEAVARVLFGEIQAQGILPCTIPGITSVLEN